LPATFKGQKTLDYTGKEERRERMKNVRIVPVLLAILFIPWSAAWSITLVRVGYIDIDVVVETYTARYLETQIAMREDFLQQLRDTYNNQYYEMGSAERNDYRRQIDDQREALNLLTYSNHLLETTGGIREAVIKRIVQRDIMEAIKKTSELEGFSLVLDNSGNFVYGSDDINLTEKVLFRLDEKLLDLQNNTPLAPLELELEDEVLIEDASGTD
jgi:Skp family chaperone for outer membrane proteins